MDGFAIDAEREVITRIDRELDLVRGAIELVASGGAPRVRLASLRFGEQLLDPARRLGAAAGVRVAANWTSDEGGAGITVEPMGDG